MIGQHDEHDVRQLRVDDAQDVDAGAAVELIVEDYVLRSWSHDSGDGVVRGAGVADHLDAVDFASISTRRVRIAGSRRR